MEKVAILKDLDHPNIVKAMETFFFRNQLFIVLELCSGGDLYTRDPYTEQDACRIVRSITSAIAYIHSKRVTHRDLKYENVSCEKMCLCGGWVFHGKKKISFAFSIDHVCRHKPKCTSKID